MRTCFGWAKLSNIAIFVFGKAKASIIIFEAN